MQMTSTFNSCGALAAALVLLCGVPASNAQDGKAAVTGTFGNWKLYTTDAAGQKMCFVAAAPSEKQPPGASRATVLFYVSAWPKDGIRSEISVTVGYLLKAGSNVSVSVESDVFQLFAKKERAYVEDTTQELKLLEAMKKGSTMVVKGTSERGTATTDSYSLNGISQALKALASTCS